ncbi:dTDP-4-dehydrorhamnose 3,5-epimerase family protein [Streptomyces sp. TLI_171]|uniref:dTDP-4-dehydrorhamnose 3,5-epimerase family protein n=1 Tax=Streptomyces sp. TLI_171 TaxID=1938859 RepID=UPI000C191D45|nr:dTDP-4-dehydrorhamnose 3,5-epimerase family protein [Streptomyces sp. TLI_171]RKE21289.1 NDP-hexose 3,5-(Or5-) epimerase [Streptomyces sp. TLI_171]
MGIHETELPDVYRITPKLLPDARGNFFESYRREALAEATGHAFTPLQVNYSTSSRNTLRGIHGVTIPPGQAKFVSCVRGVLVDVVIDVRLGSPTFGRHIVTRLDASEGTAVYVAEGLAHGFVALTDDACVSYLCSTEYVPGTQFDIQPFDPDMGIPWERWLDGEALVSEKDRTAPSLAEHAERGTLAGYEECRALYARNRAAAR